MADEATIKMGGFAEATQVKDSDQIIILQDGDNKRIKSPVFERKIINRTVEELSKNGGVSLNLVNLKGVVPTYADLALITPTPELNDAYQVEADGLVYIYTENGFQSDGEGFNVQPNVNGVVEEGNEQAVSGDETYKAISIALDLSDEFKVNSLVPADRSNITQTSLYSLTAYYFEEGNCSGFNKLFVNAALSGNINIAIITHSGLYGAVIESVIKPVVVGINEFIVSDLGFNPDNLEFPNFVIGLSPETAMILPFQSSATGSFGTLNVIAKNNGSITKTTHRGCSWVEIEKTPYLVEDYPKTKDLLESTVNKENTFTDIDIPYSKESLVLPTNGTVGYLYGDSETFYSLENDLKDLRFNSNASGFVNVYFVNIEDGNASILHTTQVSASIGVNTFTKSQLSAPTAIDSKPIYVLVGNEIAQDPNVIKGGGGNPTSRPYYTYRISNNSLAIATGLNRFNHYLTVLEPANKLVAEVDRLTQIVDNLPTNKGVSLYDYNTNYPILPCDIFVDEAKPTPLFKNSLFQKYIGQELPSVKLISDNKTFDIQDPAYINHSEIGDLARILIDKHLEPNNILYKDLNVYKFDSSSKSGSISIMSLGDSLIEGGNGFATSPIYILTRQLKSLGITVSGIGTLQRTYGSVTQRYEGRGAWRYRTFVGLESKFASLNVVIPSPNKNVWVEGVDGNINTIKANNPYLYEATPQDLIDFPQWCFHFVTGATTNNVSYAENPSLGTYHIFSPNRYFSERSIDFPNVLTIALGTNEWYLGGFSGWDFPLITSCADWMIQRFLDAVPSTTAVIVIPCNNMPLTRETEWQEKASFLTSSVLKLIEEKKSIYSNLYSLSIFAHGSRQLAYNKELSVTELSNNNTTKIAIVDSDVHVLNTNDEGRYDYIDALKTSILYFA